jgi:hypothetical protein
MAPAPALNFGCRSHQRHNFCGAVRSGFLNRSQAGSIAPTACKYSASVRHSVPLRGDMFAAGIALVLCRKLWVSVKREGEGE